MLHRNNSIIAIWMLHTICNLLCLVAFTWHNIFRDHPCCSMYQNIILFCLYITFCLSFYWFMDIGVFFPTFCPLYVVFFWTFMCKFLSGCMYSTLSWIYIAVELLFNFLMNYQTILQSGCTQFPFPPAVCEIWISSRLHQHYGLSFLLQPSKWVWSYFSLCYWHILV